MEQKWISVNDRLPTEGQICICWCLGDAYKICRYRKILTWSGRKLVFINTMSHGFEAGDVTHWMPFPKPPEK